jgi:stearoyl-CoA desaturase (delta-9 desaturase)
MSWLVWGGFVRTIFVLHATWFVNSATHVWGYRSHSTRDNSTNLWWVALITYGEGWHNNHHAYQTSARHGLRWWEIDSTYIAIRAMEFCGIAYSVKLPKLRSAETETPLMVPSQAATAEAVH